MMIKLTPEAERKILASIGNRPGNLRIVYDTEGCGCAVNGIPGLRLIDQPDQEDMRLESNGSIAVYMNRRQEVFFEDHMKLDLTSDRYAFRLDSDNQTYGTNIQIVDTRL